MNRYCLFAIASLGMPCLIAVAAQDNVTIPKSRLEELQRKEAELERLKGDLNTTQVENDKLKKQHQQDAVKIREVKAAPPAHSSPPINSLPPLAEGEAVESMDLSDYYATDSASADQRFGKRTLKLRGEIVRFEHPPFLRYYKIHLKSAHENVLVICTLAYPDKYKAIYSVKYGKELVGRFGDQSEPIARVGDTAVISGLNNGIKDSIISLSRCELNSPKLPQLPTPRVHGP
jgi:hypothetical protein